MNCTLCGNDNSDMLWQPTLKRTPTKLVLYHAVKNGKVRRRTAKIMADLGWQWDDKAGYFYTRLTPDELKKVLAAWTVNKGTNYAKVCLNLSSGVWRMVQGSDYYDT